MSSDHFISATVSVLLAITGLAILAVLVSRQSQTGQVFKAGGGAFAQMICKALSPVTGSSCGGGGGGGGYVVTPPELTPDVNSTITFPDYPEVGGRFFPGRGGIAG